MKRTGTKAIILYFLAGVLLLWVIDAVIDSVFFSKGSFLGSFFDYSPHELYFRLFILFSMLLFSAAVVTLRSRQRVIEQRYRNFVEQSSDILYVTDKEGNCVFLNDAAYSILERAPEEVISRPLTAVLHPDDRDATLERLNAVLSSREAAVNFENRFVSKNGKVIHLLHSVRVLRGEGGDVAGAQGVGRDITKRKQFEQELQDLNERTENELAKSQSILASLGDGISIQDRTFRVLFQNEAHKKQAGGDMTGRFCYEVYHHEAALCGNCPVALTFQDGLVHTMERVVTRDAGQRTLEIKSSPLKNAHGEIVAGIESVRDITERKNVSEKLALFSEAIEVALDGIQIADLNGVVLYANRSAQQMLGYASGELAGRTVRDLTNERELIDREVYPRIMDTGHWSGELTAIRKDGTLLPVWLSVSRVSQDGRPIAMIGITRDIAEKKQAEDILKRHHEQLMKLVEERTRDLISANAKLRKEIEERERIEHEMVKAQKLESLGILAGGIAHDFNNLLAAIMGNLSLAMMDIRKDDDTFRLLETAEKASLRAQDLTRQLLTFSKGGAPVKKTTALDDLVSEAIGFALRGSRVDSDISIPDGLWLADVDAGQISQVIHNLVINADHAMPEGGTVSIRCENTVVKGMEEFQMREGDYVKIVVQDHGVGIAREHLLKIFDPYFTTKQKGSGLGLATTYSIIKKHGGHIFAESELGKGTTFTLYLPASRRKVKQDLKAQDTGIIRRSGKILVMDDEEEVLQTIAAILKRLGYTAEFADGGAAAVARYQEARSGGAPFDAVIMDLTIPGGMGGKDAIRKLLEIDPRVRAIVSSGYSNDPIMADYRKYGFCGVLSKPYRIRDISEALQLVLSGEAGREK